MYELVIQFLAAKSFPTSVLMAMVSRKRLEGVTIKYHTLQHMV